MLTFVKWRNQVKEKKLNWMSAYINLLQISVLSSNPDITTEDLDYNELPLTNLCRFASVFKSSLVQWSYLKTGIAFNLQL